MRMGICTSLETRSTRKNLESPLRLKYFFERNDVTRTGVTIFPSQLAIVCGGIPPEPGGAARQLQAEILISPGPMLVSQKGKAAFLEDTGSRPFTSEPKGVSDGGNEKSWPASMGFGSQRPSSSIHILLSQTKTQYCSLFMNGVYLHCESAPTGWFSAWGKRV